MKVRVVYVVNGTTQTEDLEAPHISATIIPEGHGAAKVQLSTADRSRSLGWKLYAHCETIERIDEE